MEKICEKMIFKPAYPYVDDAVVHGVMSKFNPGDRILYDLANAFNRFYHETKIVTEEDQDKKAGWVALLMLVRDILETCIDVLGFTAPERM